MWFSRRVKSCVIRPLLFTAPFRVTPRQDLPGAVWRALLGSWTIHVFADHVVVLQTRAKSRWCWIRDAVTQEYFGACSCGWVGLVGGPPGSKAGLGWGGGVRREDRGMMLIPLKLIQFWIRHVFFLVVLYFIAVCTLSDSAVITHDVTALTLTGKLSVVTAEHGRWCWQKCQQRECVVTNAGFFC